jgi:prevent-host-death family protein
MDRVGVRELRQNLSVYLRRVTEDGETLEVTDRGEPVALLAPLPPLGDPLARLEARGLVSKRASVDHRNLPPPQRGVDTTLTSLILSDRDA